MTAITADTIGPIPPTTPVDATPCYGKAELFESIEFADHHEARAICDTCPAAQFAACQRLAAEEVEAAAKANTTIVGTWAGTLHGHRERGAYRRHGGRSATHHVCTNCEAPMVSNGTKREGEEQYRATAEMCQSCYSYRRKHDKKVAS